MAEPAPPTAGDARGGTAGPFLDRRGVTPAVGKSLEIGLVVLLVALLTTVLLGGLVPDYRRGADARVAERVLVTASQEVEAAVPPATRGVETRREVEVPGQIGGTGYRIRTDGRELVLDHPDPAVAARVRLALPDRVDRVEGQWDSGGETVVRVTGDAGGLVVTLSDGGGS